jgi:hypothetical protein
MLSTLEDIFLSISIPTEIYKPTPEDLVSWPKFLEEFRNVKVFRLHHGIETEIADILHPPAVNGPPAREEVDPDGTTPCMPINSNRNQFNLDIFPSLEEIVVHARTWDSLVGEKERTSGLETFGPFATARQQMGRPVKVFWSTDRPRYFNALKKSTLLSHVYIIYR